MSTLTGLFMIFWLVILAREYVCVNQFTVDNLLSCLLSSVSSMVSHSLGFLTVKVLEYTCIGHGGVFKILVLILVSLCLKIPSLLLSSYKVRLSSIPIVLIVEHSFFLKFLFQILLYLIDAIISWLHSLLRISFLLCWRVHIIILHVRQVIYIDNVTICVTLINSTCHLLFHIFADFKVYVAIFIFWWCFQEYAHVL